MQWPCQTICLYIKRYIYAPCFSLTAEWWKALALNKKSGLWRRGGAGFLTQRNICATSSILEKLSASLNYIAVWHLEEIT